MNSVPTLTTLEKQMGAHADLIGLGLAYDLVAATIARDAPEEPLAIAVAQEEPAPSELGPLPLTEWLRNEASYYDQRDDLPGAELIVGAIGRIADAADLHGLRSVSELLRGSPLFGRCNLSAPIRVPARRPNSLLAEIVDAEVRVYLARQTIAARLVAWVLLGLADEIDWFGAETAAGFLARKHAFESERERSARDGDDPRFADEDPTW